MVSTPSIPSPQSTQTRMPDAAVDASASAAPDSVDIFDSLEGKFTPSMQSAQSTPSAQSPRESLEMPEKPELLEMPEKPEKLEVPEPCTKRLGGPDAPVPKEAPEQKEKVEKILKMEKLVGEEKPEKVEKGEKWDKVENEEVPDLDRDVSLDTDLDLLPQKAAEGEGDADQGQGVMRQVLRDIIDDSQQLEKRKQVPVDPLPSDVAAAAEGPSAEPPEDRPSAEPPEDPFALFEDFEFDGAVPEIPSSIPGLQASDTASETVLTT